MMKMIMGALIKCAVANTISMSFVVSIVDLVHNEFLCFLTEGGSDSFLRPFSEKNKLSDMKAGIPSSPSHVLRVQRGSHSKHITHSSRVYSIPVFFISLTDYRCKKK